MEKQPKNQLEAVKMHLEKWEHLTSLDAFKDYGITRLSDIIYKLRNNGLKITTLRGYTVNRFGNKVSYGIYQLEA